MIVCLVHDAVTVGGWILDVPSGRMAVAIKGQGVTLDGVAGDRHGVCRRTRSASSATRSARPSTRNLPAADRQRLGRVSTLRCAGVEYLDILSGRADFSLYRITKPWDHAAGALMMAEAGGGSLRFDGSPYGAGAADQCRHHQRRLAGDLAEVRAVFEAIQMPLLAPRP